MLRIFFSKNITFSYITSTFEPIPRKIDFDVYFSLVFDKKKFGKNPPQDLAFVMNTLCHP